MRQGHVKSIARFKINVFMRLTPKLFMKKVYGGAQSCSVPDLAWSHLSCAAIKALSLSFGKYQTPKNEHLSVWSQ